MLKILVSSFQSIARLSAPRLNCIGKILEKVNYEAYRPRSALTLKLIKLVTNYIQQVLPVRAMVSTQLRSKKDKTFTSSSREIKQVVMPADELKRIVWVDLEMSGLDVDKDKILEAACIITDNNLNIIAEGPNIIVHQPDEVLLGMSTWCKNHHGKSGLSEAVRKSKVTIEKAEDKLLDFVQSYIGKGVCPIAGNSVYMDRLFLRRYMPRFDDYMHYRIIDVSSVKELCRRWNPSVYKAAPGKEFNHRALDDIKESISELKYYKSTFFK